MKYLLFYTALLILSCNTSSTEKQREHDSTKVDGTRVTDTTLVSDSVPPNIENPQPD